MNIYFMIKKDIIRHICIYKIYFKKIKSIQKSIMHNFLLL